MPPKSIWIAPLVAAAVGWCTYPLPFPWSFLIPLAAGLVGVEIWRRYEYGW